jgi:hypothetical protein
LAVRGIFYLDLGRFVVDFRTVEEAQERWTGTLV